MAFIDGIKKTIEFTGDGQKRTHKKYLIKFFLRFHFFIVKTRVCHVKNMELSFNRIEKLKIAESLFISVSE